MAKAVWNGEVVAESESEMGPPAIDVTAADPPLTLGDLEGIALANNPTLAGAAAGIGAARGKELQAGLYPNPVVGYDATQIGNLGTTGQQGGFVSQKFITAGKLHLDQAIAGKRTDEARFRLQEKRQRVISDVRVRFYDALTRKVIWSNAAALLGLSDSAEPESDDA